MCDTKYFTSLGEIAFLLQLRIYFGGTHSRTLSALPKIFRHGSRIRRQPIGESALTIV